jgi:hypothetical protein
VFGTDGSTAIGETVYREGVELHVIHDAARGRFTGTTYFWRCADADEFGTPRIVNGKTLLL